MKLYLVMHGVDYEGDTVEGVFSSEEKARSYIEKTIQSGYLARYKWAADQEGCWRSGDRSFYVKEEELDVEKEW